MTERARYRAKVAVWWAFGAGIVFRGGVAAAHQDALGLERYLETVRQSWIELPWIVGAGLAVLALLGLVSALRDIDREARRDS